MKKKFLSILACMAVILVGGIALTACGESTSADTTVSLYSGELSWIEQTWSNSADLKIEQTSTYTYNISGTASTMSEAQANAIWQGTAASGDRYVVINFQLEEGETLTYFSNNAESKSAAYGSEYVDSNGCAQLVLRVAGTSATTDARAFTISSTNSSVTYTITFNGLVVEDAE